jgi:hypothetical protein
MTKVEELLTSIKEERERKREECKVAVQEMLDNKEISYCDALNIFKESRLFDIYPFILSDHKDTPINILLDEYDEGYEDRYATIYFTDISDWIEWSEGEIQEALDAAGITDNPHKILYDYAVKTNYIGYTFDW